jgi:hypothetical protein
MTELPPPITNDPHSIPPIPAESDDGMDDYRHFVAFHEQVGETTEYRRATLAVSMFGAGLKMMPPLTPESTFANVLGGQACLHLAQRQLRAAVHLLLFGYYSEVRCLLRASYEAAGLGRMLAKEPDKAERWLRKMSWFPDREVRAWLKEAGRVTDDQHADFGRFYGRLSSWAHPTALSALLTAEMTDESITFGLVTRPNLAHARTLLDEIAATAIFCAFALRNAAVSEQALDPEWRRDLYAAMEDLTGQVQPHLQRDWDLERAQYDRLAERTRDVAELDDELRSNPRGWHNLSTDETDDGDR